MMSLMMQCNDIIKNGVMKVFPCKNAKHKNSIGNRDVSIPAILILTSVTFSPPFPCHAPMTEFMSFIVQELYHKTKLKLKCFSLLT